MSSIDSLLNDSMDNIDELPSTAPWPNGAHLAKVSLKYVDKDPKKPKVIAKLVLISTEEQADPNATPAKPGDEYAIFAHLMKKDGTRNDYAIKELRTRYGTPAIAAGLVDQSAPLSALLDTFKDGVEMLVTTKARTDSDGRESMELVTAVIA